MKRASEEMLMFVRDVRVIYQSVLFGGFSSDEAVVGDSELPADTLFFFLHKMEAALPVCQVLSYLSLDVLYCRCIY